MASEQEAKQQVIEAIANLEHEQWMKWAKSILPELQELTRHHLPYGKEIEVGNCGCKTCQRIKRWQALFKPYSELTEEQKEQDRKEVRIKLALTYPSGNPMIGILDADQTLPTGPNAQFAKLQPAIEQAEISFKAGQQSQAAFDQLNFDKERAEFWKKITEAKKEVVDFIKGYRKGNIYEITVEDLERRYQVEATR